MAEVRPNLELWIKSYLQQCNIIRFEISEIKEAYEKLNEKLDRIQEHLELINNGNNTLIDYFNSEIKKENENG